MASLASLFCCCRRRARKDDPERPGESEPLIPPSDEIPRTSETLAPAVDHQQLQERMQTIVQAKQGRMVDIDARRPFRLHRDLTTDSPSHSRSYTGRGTSSSRAPANGNGPDDHGAGASVPPSRSHSTASLGYGGLDSSLASLAQLPHPSADRTRARVPALDVRIIERLSPTRAGRSRSRGRMGRFGERGDREPGAGALEAAAPSGGDMTTSVGITVEHAEEVPDNDSVADDSDGPLGVEGLPTDLTPNSMQREIRKKFTLQSPAVVARSWGD